MQNNNIILIGMPASGKSTVGVVLAKMLGYAFLDADLCIQQQTGKLLHQIIAQEGQEGFREIENKVNAALTCQNTVIATGGSAVYGQEAMAHLRSIGTVVYLQVPLESLKLRLGADFSTRGISMYPGQTLADLYEERCPLYQKYAHITVPDSGEPLAAYAAKIKAAVENQRL